MEEDCKHPVRMGSLCGYCGKDVSELDGQEASEHASILHSVPGLLISTEEAQKIEKETKRQLLSSRKLSLVVDLDQTVLHATIDPSVTAMSIPGVFQVTLPETPNQIYNIKLRPGLAEFLTAMSHLFEMHVYTMGSRSYAHAVVRLFDPDGRLFYDRILSRDDVFPPSVSSASNGEMEQKKYLKRIFPVDDSMVLIIDDRADVWDYGPNLIPVPPYSYFLGIGDINRTGKNPLNFLAKSADPTHETITDAGAGIEEHTEAIITDDKDNELILIRRILEDIHSMFYQNQGVTDVKEIIAEKRQAVLNGTSIVFSGVIPRGMRPERFELWRLAEMFGATCVDAVSEATHLVTIRNDTDKVIQAMEAGIAIVTPQWLVDSLKRWERADASLYELRDLPKRPPEPSHNYNLQSLSQSQSMIDLDLAMNPEDLQAMREELDLLSDGDEDDDETPSQFYEDPDNENQESESGDEIPSKKMKMSKEDQHDSDTDLDALERELFL